VSADIINLNQFRKARLKDEKREKAAENRQKFGRSKAEKLVENKDREKSERLLAGKKLTDPVAEEDKDGPV
jgi:tRNA A37 methylthiotransferase MiaB